MGMIKPSVSPDAGSEVRFQAYLSALSEVIGHADRIDPLRRYCTGLLLPGERKSVEPMAAKLDPLHVPATHQSLHHFVAKAPWSDTAVLAAVREQVLPALTRHGPITAWILDDTGFPKKGTHSVGVARQYCGQLGKQDNCQVAVSLSLANDLASLPVAFDLYLPEEWIRFAAPRQGSQRCLRSGPSRRSRWSRSDARWPAARCRAGRCRLWHRDRLPHGADRRVLELCPGGAIHPWRLAARMRSLAAQAVVGQGAPAQAPASGCRASAGQRQGPRRHPAAECLADGELARGQPRCPERALRRSAGAPLPSRLLAGRAASGGVAADRVAGGRPGAVQVLALDLAGDHRPGRSGSQGQTALAD